jgi:hypothetical protein
VTDQQPQPDWAKQLEAAFKDLGDAFTRIGHNLTMQTVLGLVLQGEFDKAREQLAKLPPAQVDIAGMAARALAVLADEEVAKRT